MKTKINFLAIVTFYTIAIALRYLTNETPLLDVLPPGFLKVILHGIGPAIGALVAFLLFKIKPDLSLRGNYIDTASAFLLYWGLALFLILGVEYVTKGTCSVLGVTAVLIYGLLEELGWRGFLQQRFKQLPEVSSVLIIATLWFVWHLNFELTTSNLMFFGILLLGSWGIGKVADRTHSLLAVSAFHSLNNFFPHMNSLRFIILMVLLSTWVISLVIRKRELQINVR
jgi:membrane protease YdiL (CAAX protease family)